MDIVKTGFNAINCEPLTIDDFLKVNGVNRNNLHSLTISCQLNVNGLLHN